MVHWLQFSFKREAIWMTVLGLLGLIAVLMAIIVPWISRHWIG